MLFLLTMMCLCPYLSSTPSVIHFLPIIIYPLSLNIILVLSHRLTWFKAKKKLLENAKPVYPDLSTRPPRPEGACVCQIRCFYNHNKLLISWLHSTFVFFIFEIWIFTFLHCNVIGSMYYCVVLCCLGSTYLGKRGREGGSDHSRGSKGGPRRGVIRKIMVK